VKSAVAMPAARNSSSSGAISPRLTKSFSAELCRMATAGTSRPTMRAPSWL
jgi:hypothetical protein